MTTANDIILGKLREIERDRSIRVILAVESGSRMWGFASPDSDYDVPFVYVREDTSVYRKFDHFGVPYNDTIQHMSADRLYDFSGWDLPKFLRYLVGMNLTVVEWSTSPVVYIDEGVHEAVAAYVRGNTAFRLLVPAHRGMLLSEKACGLENVKRAMYAARSLLALRVLHVRGEMPRDFTWQTLIARAGLTDDERSFFERLHGLKVSSAEKSSAVPADIKGYLEEEREKYRQKELPSARGLVITAEEKSALDAIWAKFTFDECLL